MEKEKLPSPEAIAEGVRGTRYELRPDPEDPQYVLVTFRLKGELEQQPALRGTDAAMAIRRFAIGYAMSLANTFGLTVLELQLGFLRAQLEDLHENCDCEICRAGRVQ